MADRTRNIITIGYNIPYHFSHDDILYWEGEHVLKVEKWRIDFYRDHLLSLLPDDNSERSYFDQLTDLIHQPFIWAYFSDKQRESILKELIDPFRMDDIVITYSLDKEPMLLKPAGQTNIGSYQFEAFPIGTQSFSAVLQQVLRCMEEEDSNEALHFDKDPYTDQELSDLLRNVLWEMRHRGISEEKIRNIINEAPQLKVLVTKDNRIILPDKNNLEVKMAPLDKAVYLLFLLHPEGIAFKDLPDYSKELKAIYKQIVDYRLVQDMKKSIDRVTDPTDNSINEKCARIRRAWIEAIGEPAAQPYYISGRRGAPKGIHLRHDLVTWEEPITVFYPF